MLARTFEWIRFRFSLRRIRLRPRWPMAVRNHAPTPFRVVKRGEFLFVEPRPAP